MWCFANVHSTGQVTADEKADQFTENQKGLEEIVFAGEYDEG